MKTHQYEASIEWTGNTGTGTSDYADYERSHEIIINNKSRALGHIGHYTGEGSVAESNWKVLITKME